MEQKLFLLIATFFCIALVKSEDAESDEYDDTEELPSNPVELGVPYPGGFPKDVLLCEAISHWGGDKSKLECIQKQYKNGSDFLNDAIKDFSEDLSEALSQTLDQAREKLVTKPDFKTVAQKNQDSLQELSKLLKEYPQKLSELVEKGDYDEMKTVMENYKSNIEDRENEFNKNFLELKDMMFDIEDLKRPAKDLENKRNSELNELTDAGQQVMELLKKCMEEKTS